MLSFWSVSFLVVDGNLAEHEWFAHVLLPSGADYWIETQLDEALASAAMLRPAVVVLAAHVGGRDSIPYVDAFRQAAGGAHVVVTTPEVNKATETRACDAGAFSCVPKIDPVLLRAILVVARLRSRPPVRGVLSGASDRRKRRRATPSLHPSRSRRGPGR